MRRILHYLLKFIASAVVRKYHPLIIGITGSVGKTSTRNAIEAVLRPSFRVRASIKSYNNELGVPLTILGEHTHGKNIPEWLLLFARSFRLLLGNAPHYPQILILEMGASKPGDLAYLTSMAPPTIGILTGIGEAHMEFFKTPSALLEEKKHIIACPPPQGLALVNRDDERIWALRAGTRANLVSVGQHLKADFSARELEVVYEEVEGNPVPLGMRMKMQRKGSLVPISQKGVLGEGHMMSALFALAVGEYMGLMLREVTTRLKTYIPPPGRMRLVPGIKQTLLLDDSYNASPKACRMALEVLQKLRMPGGAEKWAILGDMKELGALTRELHYEIGKSAAGSNLDWLITVGECGAMISSAAQENGMEEDRVFHFNTPQEAGKFVQKKLQPHDVVLIKASRAMHFEKITQELMAEPLRAQELLVS